jgi:hypothetical protein
MNPQEPTSNLPLLNLQQQMRVMAVQMLLTKLLVEVFRSDEQPSSAAKRWMADFERSAGLIAFPGEDPALSDFAAQELRDVGMRILRRAEAQATGAPYDPERFRKRQD